MSRDPTHLTSAMTGLELRNLVILNNSWGDKADEKIKICFLASQEKTWWRPNGQSVRALQSEREATLKRSQRSAFGKGDQVDGP